MANAGQLAAFRARWEINRAGGLRARAARLPVAHAVLMHRLGLKRWVRARLFSGETLWVHTGESTSSGLLSFGYAEAALTALMLDMLRPGMRVVDVGAHIGYEAVVASALVGEHGKVVSFEAQPAIAAWTARNLQRYPQARLQCCAVGAAVGDAQFVELDMRDSALSGLSGTVPAGRTGRTITVPLTTLDCALAPAERPVDFLKCDVEGGELEVLRGARDILERDRPLLVLEAGMPGDAATGTRTAELQAQLEPLGYSGLSFEFDGALCTAPIGTLRAGHANVAFIPEGRSEFAALKASGI